GDDQANVLDGGPAGKDTVSGNGGDDTLTVTALAGALVDGGAGSDTLMVRGTAGADSLDVGATSVILNGLAADTVSYANVEQLAVQGLDGNDTFTIHGTVTADLAGGAGNDRVVVGSGAALAGSIDGGSGSDTLDYSASAAARQVTLTGPGAADGFAGTASAVGGGF